VNRKWDDTNLRCFRVEDSAAVDSPVGETAALQPPVAAGLVISADQHPESKEPQQKKLMILERETGHH
jgi:hypothetical protein